ncbi:8129_t:CDS:2, partial [Diversispora eburnea]
YNSNQRLKMTVASLTHLMIKKDPSSNKCPLKVSLVGITQEPVKEVNDENAMIRMLVKDYVGHLEVIQDDLYVYAIETSYIDTYFTDRRRVSNVSEDSSKVFAIDNSDKSEETNQSVIDLSISDSCSSKRIKLENEEIKPVSSDVTKDRHMVEQDNKCVDENNVLEKNIISENKGRGHG